MDRDLPNVYAGIIDKEIKNDQEIYSNINRSSNNINIREKINKIFSSTDFVYKKDVRITTNEGIINTTIVGINNNNLLTMNNEAINISDIIDIN